ncbi:MAG: hypothetical protein SCALA701_16080 [Candidatus Scalindua sp.]|nr:MAG: hypothetical protein SCALA701_16080 [Candidatus Scalindua sp.]
MYRELSPHKIMLTPGTHNQIHTDSKKRRSFLALFFADGDEDVIQTFAHTCSCVTICVNGGGYGNKFGYR